MDATNRPTVTTDATSNRVSFEYGDFDIDPSQSSVVDLLFTVTVEDEAFADGLALTNQVRRTQASTNAGSIVNDEIVQIRLAEPVLNITKGIVATSNPADVYTPSTPGPVTFNAPGTAGARFAGTINSNGLATNPIDSDVQFVDAGDLVTFAVVVENTGSSRRGAFDVSIRDALPPGFAVPSGGLNLRVTDGSGTPLSFSSLGTGLLDASGGIVLDDPGNTPDTGDGTNAGSLDEFDGTSGNNLVVVTYDLEVLASANPNQLLTSDATLFNYASIEGGSDHTVTDLTDPASTQVQTIGIAKTLQTSNQTHTAGNDVAIGEILTYRAVLTIPEGDAQTVQWTDTPDPGMSIIGVTSIVASSTDLTSDVGPIGSLSSSIAANGDSVSINFGTLGNSNRDNSVAETITIQYDAVVTNAAANVRGFTLDNTASMSWTGGTSSADGPDVTVVEPEIAISKTITPAGGQASSVFDVVLEISHAGISDADAFDVSLSDVLPAGLNYYTVNNPVQNTAGVAPDTLQESGGTITATFASLPLGQSSEIRFQVQADSAVVAGTTITNTANTAWTGLSGDVTTPQSSDPLSTERTGDITDPGTTVNDYRASASDDVVVDSPVPTKTLVSTNQTHTTAANVAIGEIATYQVQFNVPNGTMPDVEFVDTPDSGLGIVDVISVSSSSTDLTSDAGTFPAIATAAIVAANGSSVTFDFGDLTNVNTDTTVAETITIQYRAVVLNTATNDRGDVLDNSGSLTWNTGSSSVVDGPDLTIVEPELNVTVSNGTPATADAGDTVSWTVVLDHAPGSNATAFDINLRNAINAVGNHLTYVPGSMSVVPSGGASVDTSADTGGELSLSMASLPVGESVTVTFQTTVDNTAPGSAALRNEASIDFTSLPGDVSTPQSSSALSVERFGASPSNPTPPAQNDHDATDDGIVTTSPAQATKIVLSTDQAATATGQHNAAVTDVLIGEIVTYQITGVLPEGTSPLTITDTLPLGMEWVSSRVVSIGGSLATGTPTVTTQDSNTDTIIDGVQFDFGSVLNTPDGIQDAGDEIVVEVVARVRDVVGNVNALTLTNQAEVDLGVGSSTATADVEVVEPILNIIKSSQLSGGVPGTTENFTVTIQHTGASTADAYDVLIADLLADPNLTLVPGTVTTDRGTITTGNGGTDTTIGLSLDRLDIGDTITITFDAIINPSAGGGVTVDTPATLQWDSLPGAGGRIGNDTDPEPFVTTAPEVDLAVTIDDGSLVTTTDRELIYTVTVTNNGPSTATNVDVTTLIDSDLIVTGGNTVVTNLGTMLPGETQTFTITTRTPIAVPTPDIVTTTATVTANEIETNNANNNDPDTTQILPGARVAGTSWVDINQNGIVDAGETLLPAVELVLTGIDEDGVAVSEVTTTDALGNYQFDQLRPGNYRIAQVQPTLFADGSDYVGTGAGSAPANDVFDLVLAAGDDETGYDFTEAGLRPEYLGKRRLLRSDLVGSGGINPLSADDFFAIFAPSGGGDFDSDTDVDNDDYLLFLDRLGAPFAL
ncbi:MAG: isopeptide-forming domain-containing fimbrial protein [Planctomycetota bacterium]